MGTLIGGIDDQALEALDAYLTSGRGPVNRRGLSDLDGFLAALAVGPDMVTQSEWLPVVWGQEQPGFENLDEANEILSAIIGRFNTILRQLDRNEFAPLLQQGLKGHTTAAADWCQGFLDGVRLRLDSWDAFFRDEEWSDLLYPILALCRDYTLCREWTGNLLDIDPGAEEKLLKQAPELIPACAEAIYTYWRDREREWAVPPGHPGQQALGPS